MSEADIERLNALLRAGLARHLAFAVVEGRALEATAWAEHRVNQRGYQLLDLPNTAWPTPALVWDLTPVNWHHAMDGMAAEAFAADYPHVALFEVERAELEAVLAPGARRLKDPFSQAYRSKTARLVAHLESGAQVTPPFVVHTSAGWAFAGGYHRFGWACHLGLAKMPILVRAGEQARLASAAPSLTEMAA